MNLLEPGETVLVAVNGVFGERISAIAERAGARVLRVEAEMGEIVPPERFIAEIEARRPALVALVHAETSTGVEQPIAEIARAARARGCARAGRLRDLARGHRRALRRVAARRRLLGYTEMSRLPARALAGGARRARARAARPARAAGAELVPRLLADRPVPGREPRLPPHRADLDDLRAARGGRARARRRPRGALRAPPRRLARGWSRGSSRSASACSSRRRTGCRC